ncbi:glycosyltransferase family 2 protein [Halodesulfovibrio sp.]|uniref:glycosyltransferase family 2 protein n=1 Tax=Halodesulfovibrio sp. TaxID=1912772 RepID=UPI0025E07B1E|nr:glycosyltransferase family 2 protein [Halodesulfovibrio sp.]MCT4535550.1 glycosyltransferase [Halodesulfovibrio sp.]
MLSIIVCTYNRSSFLASCLESLIHQTISTLEFEVVVVNNNSGDNTQEVALSFQNKFPNFVYLEEKNQGLSFARNAGINAAKGDWVAFLDDDAVARQNWIEQILATITKNDFDIFGGVYTAWHALKDRPAWFSSDWETNASVASEYSVLKESYPSGGNCAYRRVLLIEGEGFPTELGMKGNNTAYGEETALIDRLRKNGAVVGFVPTMIIDHCVVERKYSLLWRLQRSFAVGRDSVTIWQEDSLTDLLKPLVKCAYYAITAPFKTAIRFATRSDYFWQNAVLDLCSQFVFNLGRVVGWVKVRCQ